MKVRNRNKLSPGIYRRVSLKGIKRMLWQAQHDKNNKAIKFTPLPTTMQKISHDEIIYQIIENNPKTLNLDDLKHFKRDFAKKYKLASIPTNIQLLKAYHQLVQDKKIAKNKTIEKLLRKRAIRSQSGIVAVQVLTKPFWCPGKCIFCPNDPEMPKSYIKTEPGAMRALLNQFDPIKQVYNRLLSLSLTGHATDKIEMIVLGGTRDVYPQDYKIKFIKALYDACNTFDQLEFKMKEDEENTQTPPSPDLPCIPSSQEGPKSKKPPLGREVPAKQGVGSQDDDAKKRFGYTITNQDNITYPETVEESIRINQTAKNRIIGLTVETRPEYVNDENCREWRALGVTRLEMGVQSLDETVLDANERGHDVQCIKDAIHKLRQYGFKFSIHIMPGLYKATTESDIQTMQNVYADPSIKPDEMKFYPTSVIPNTGLYDLYKAGKYTPITTQEIITIVEESFENIIPPYSRIKRLIRDIPSTEIESGSNVTNLAQLIHNDLKNKYKKDDMLRKKFYARLYGDYTQVTTHEQAREMIHKDISTLTSDETKTYIIGDAQPDFEQYRNFVSLDTRSREIRNRKNTPPPNPLPSKERGNPQGVNTVIRMYKSSVGTEFFISKEDELGYLYGFTRLLLPDDDKVITDLEGIGKDIAMIRELHIYGQLAKIQKRETSWLGKIWNAITGLFQFPLKKGDVQQSWIGGFKKQKNTHQHKGFGSQLMQTAEFIAQQSGYTKLSVISGVGVRAYYQKIGYSLGGTYMVKKL
ncbi:MAG: hypothetical protein CR971_01915 [candidate division SR1 bacterium]|nr:MAG: hypothetical protein CR971_01915 [candidate division SR1 bacterium]